MCPPIGALKHSLQTFDLDCGLENTVLQPIMWCIIRRSPHDTRIIGSIHLDPGVGGNFLLLNANRTLTVLYLMLTGGCSRGAKMATTWFLSNKTYRNILFSIHFQPYQLKKPLSEIGDDRRFIYFNICSCEALTSGSGSMTICHVPLHTCSLVFQKFQ